MIFTLVYDAREESDVKEKLLPLLEEMISGSRAFSEEKPEQDGAPMVSPDEHVLLYLSDPQIKMFLKSLGETDVTLAVLPHPGAERFSAITGAGGGLGKTVKHLPAGYQQVLQIHRVLETDPEFSRQFPETATAQARGDQKRRFQIENGGFGHCGGAIPDRLAAFPVHPGAGVFQ